MFISFQNGLGNEELIAELMGEDRVLGGLTAQGANIEVTLTYDHDDLSTLSGPGAHPGPHSPDHLGGGDGGPGQWSGHPAVWAAQ